MWRVCTAPQGAKLPKTAVYGPGRDGEDVALAEHRDASVATRLRLFTVGEERLPDLDLIDTQLDLRPEHLSVSLHGVGLPLPGAESVSQWYTRGTHVARPGTDDGARALAEHTGH